MARIVDIREKTFWVSRYADQVSRYADPAAAPGELTTSAVAIVTDVVRDGAPVVGFGFSSFGRFGQSGLIRERFAPRLLAAREEDLRAGDENAMDPFKAWECMMKGEKPGGHGERCVAVGTLDMALWDAAAKIAGKPLYRYLADRVFTDRFLAEQPLVDNLGETGAAEGGLGRRRELEPVPVYAGGGYSFPEDDLTRLEAEARQFLDQGFTRLKIKIGGGPAIAGPSIAVDLARIEAVLKLLPAGEFLAADAMNRYSSGAALQAAFALAPYRLMWLEDLCDPLDFETLRRAGDEYPFPLAAGEALFSLADARNLFRYSGLRPEQDVLVFDPVHCYGLPEYLRIVASATADAESGGWPRKAFWPHGGHLFSLHVAAALGLGGCEANPHNFQPFGGFGDTTEIVDGKAFPPDAPGIGFETKAALYKVFRELG